MRGWMLWIVLGGVAHADDPTGPMDIDLGEIDLGGPEQNMLTYSGGFTQRTASKLAIDASISVNNPGGTTSVYCTDTEFLEGRLDYTVEGTTEAPMQAYGDGIKLAVTGGGASGRVSLVVPSRPAAVKTSKITLVVNVPKNARLNVTSSNDWVMVSGCDGNVTASAGKNGASVDGNLRSFNVSAGAGDVRVIVKGDSKIGAASAITATNGNVTLAMGLSQDLKLDARGASVNVAHTVNGSVGANTAIGTLGAGGPALTIKASGDVTIKTP
jgi:hypothetical protein